MGSDGKAIDGKAIDGKAIDGKAIDGKAIDGKAIDRAEEGTLAELEPCPARDRSEDMHNLLAALVEQARSMAGRMAGDPERDTTCHFCAGPVALWESLLVTQLAGVPAHVACPAEILDAKLRESGPAEAFPYLEFSAAVDERLRQETPDAAAGIIVTTR